MDKNKQAEGGMQFKDGGGSDCLQSTRSFHNVYRATLCRWIWIVVENIPQRKRKAKKKKEKRQPTILRTAEHYNICCIFRFPARQAI